MIATARFDRDDEYYDKFYSAWLRYRSRYRRYAVYIWGIVLVASLVALQRADDGSMASVWVGVSVFSLIEVLSYRWRWKRKIRKMGISEWMSIEFDDDKVRFRTPLSEGQVNYEAFRKFVPTPVGLFIIQAVGLSWFVPLSSVEPPSSLPVLIEHLQQRINNRQ